MSFAADLIEAARSIPCESNPLLLAIRSGECRRETIRQYAIQTTRSAEGFPKVLCSILAVCDVPEIRRSLIGNLLEEEGVTCYVPGQGATFNPERRHGSMARRFAYAAGATDAEIDACPSAPVRWFEAALLSGNWIGALAFVAIGFEANVSPTYRLLVPALMERCGFSHRDLEFLSEHVGADERHGLDAAILIAATSTSNEARRRALEGARRGGNAWLEFHRAHVRVSRSLTVPA